MENYQFDEKIMNQGWSQMNDLLDKEMPVQKKRRIPFFWWWSAASLSVAAILLLFFNTPNFNNTNNKNNNNSTAKNAEKEKNEAIDKEINTSLKQIKSNENIFSEEKNVSNQTFLEKKPSLSNKKINNFENSSLPLINSPLQTEKEVFNSMGSVSQEKQKVETKRLSEHQEKISIASLSLLEKKLNPIDIVRGEKNIFVEKNIKKINYLQANNLKIGIFASATNGFNIGATLKKTWKRHSLSANLFWEYSSKNLGIYRSAVPVIIDSMLTYPVVFPYGDINLAKDNDGTYKTNLASDYYFSLKTRNLGIGIEHNYRFRSRWESILGFEYLREMGNRSYSFAQVKNSTAFFKSKEYALDEVTTNTFSSSGSTKSQVYEADAIQSQDELQNINVNKSVFYLTTGFSYYFGKNLKFSAIYKQGLNSTIVITPIKVMVTNNTIALRMTYYLPFRK